MLAYLLAPPGDPANLRTMAKVFLIGAGPGDPELLTLKALRLLRGAGVVLHDSLVDPRILALAGADARLIDVGKRCGRASTAQAEICSLLVAEAAAGHVVVRLKGGDPMVFGRATEEMAALTDAGIGFEIIPGVTAATAAAAALGRSLTRRGVARSLHFLTGHGALGGLPGHDWVALTRSGGTLAVYMGAGTLPGLAAHLIEAGMPPAMPAAAVENASLADQRITRGTIATIAGRTTSGGGPVVILIGEALALGLPPARRIYDAVQEWTMADETAKKHVIDVPDLTPTDMDILPATVEFIVLKARAFDVKVPPVEPDPGSNAADDQERGVLQDYASDATEEELRDAIEQLSDDEKADLVAMLWIGRGDFTGAEFKAARGQAIERGLADTAAYLMGEPAMGDFLAEGLSELGYPPEAFVPE